MQPRVHVAVHLPPDPFNHRSVAISPNWGVAEAVSPSSPSPGSLKYRLYADRLTLEHCSRLSSSSLTMQNNLSFSYLCYQRSSGLHHSESTSASNVAPADVAQASTSARVPAYPHGITSAHVPVIGNSGNVQTAFSDATEKLPRVARLRAAWEYTPPAPSLGCDYSFDAHQRSWTSTAETERTNPYAPPADWEQSHLTGMQPNRSQVPSGTNVPGSVWSHRADDRHAVAAPTQHASLLGTDYLSRDIRTPLYMPTSIQSSTSQVHTGLDGVRCRMAPSIPGQVPSPSHHRRRFRRSHPYPDRATCDQCQKQMRPQSLKRHIREVHDRVKRHVKSGFRRGP